MLGDEVAGAVNDDAPWTRGTTSRNAQLDRYLDSEIEAEQPRRRPVRSSRVCTYAEARREHLAFEAGGTASDDVDGARPTFELAAG